MNEPRHIPVLPREVIQWLDPQPGQTIVDGTLGAGGHARLIAENIGPKGRVIGLDRDPRAVQSALSRLSEFPIQPIHACFSHLRQVLDDLSISRVDGVLLDLGLSSDQLADELRGFSFDASGPLDLRFDPTSDEPAWRLLEQLSEKRLADLIYEFGEERKSRKIARRIVEARRKNPIRTASELADLVRRGEPRRRNSGEPRRRNSGEPRRRGKIDPATRTFQALRIAVNGELENLEAALREIPHCLREGGRLVVISFHSLEDRRVKVAFRDDPAYEALTRKPIRPQEEELAENRRCRSSRLRAARHAAAPSS